jgi:protoporphyrinogen oxidase
MPDRLPGLRQGESRWYRRAIIGPFRAPERGSARYGRSRGECMYDVDTLIVGGGITGLSVAAFLGPKADYLLLERENELGGYCRTVKREGFTWDYSGHFFHFRHPRIEQYLRERMVGENIRTVAKRSFIHFADKWVDFPFQKNIHQLPQQDFIDCLHDLYFAQKESAGAPAPRNFEEMLFARYGRGMAEKFLIPYNEKLYATKLSHLDVNAMGRFFPHVSMDEVVRNMRTPDNASYNQTFTYPEGGAMSYVNALAREVRPDAVRLEEGVTRIDTAARVVHTAKGSYRYRKLVSSMPLPHLLRLCGREAEVAPLTWNQVLVFNLGFDRKGPRDVHWVYYPQRDLPFYRLGFYDNIFDTERMSLYVELGFDRNARPDAAAALPGVLEGLAKVGVVRDHKLVASHSVVMNPAYVHINEASTALYQRFTAEMAPQGVYSMGRYGRWTYCSIEDNILEAEAWVKAHGAS